MVLSFLPLVFGMVAAEEMQPSVSKRDPFKSPLVIEVDTPIVPIIPTSPLMKFTLSEFKLVGIVWGALGRVAVVEAPDGKCYLIKKGEEIGKLQGKIIKINQESVVVLHRIKDYTGKVKKKEVTIKLYKEKEKNL